jgi:hypothetical protein
MFKQRLKLIANLIVSGGLLLPTLICAQGYVYSGRAVQAVDQITLNTEGADKELNIDFDVDVHYLSHFPQSEGSEIRIELEVMDPCDAALLNRPLHIPGIVSKEVPPFDLYFPAVMAIPGNGRGVCQSSGKQNIETNKILLIKFNKSIRYTIKASEDHRRITVIFPAVAAPVTKMVNSETSLPGNANQPVAMPVKPSMTVPDDTAKNGTQQFSAPIQTPVANETQVATNEPANQVPSAPSSVNLTKTEVLRASSDTTVPLDGSKNAAPPQQAPAVTAKPLSTLPADAPPKLVLDTARQALNNGQYDLAIELYNRILNSSANEYTQVAQEQIGYAREGAGQLKMARSEYQLYLKLYPKGDGVERVKQRLIVLSEKLTKETISVSKEKKQIREAENKHPEMTVTGGISQYYYGSVSYTNNHDGTGDHYSLNQSSLISSFDITGRYKAGATETKIVIRDVDSHNFPSGPAFTDTNNLNTAYLEQTNSDEGYFYRVGRQSGISGGVLGRFDGVTGKYNINPELKVGVVLGVPDYGTHSNVQTNRYFYGGMLEYSPKGSRFSGDVYYNEQVADGLVERRAIGTDIRYFNDNISAFGMLEWDTVYSTLNMAMFQGSYRTALGTNFNLFLDHRRAPILTADTALQAVPGVTNVGTIKNALTAGQIYSIVPDLAPTTDSAVLSAFKQISQTWQVSGDVRTNRTSATNGALVTDFLTGTVTTLPAQPASGNSYGADASVIGVNLFTSADTTVLNGGVSDDPHSKSVFVALSNFMMFQQKWRLTTSLQASHSESDTNSSSNRYSPQITLSYAPKPNMNFEAQLGFDHTFNYQGAFGAAPASKTDTFREFMFIGYRWDYR